MREIWAAARREQQRDSKQQGDSNDFMTTSSSLYLRITEYLSNLLLKGKILWNEHRKWPNG